MKNQEAAPAVDTPPDKAPAESGTAESAARPRGRAALSGYLARAGVLPALALVIVIGAIASPTFLTAANFRDVLTTASIVGVLAIGEALVVLAGGSGIDLSIGAAMTLSTVVAARLQSHGVEAVILGALATGGYIGVVNGLGVTVAKLEPFIVTLATLTICTGAAYYVSGASPLYLEGAHALPWLNGRVAGIQGPIIVFVVATLIGQAILRWSVFGRELYFIGGNEEAARYAGIPVDRRRFVVYLVSGLCAGIGGLLVITQLQSADPNFGNNYNLQAIAAVVVGGVPLMGGRGSLLGTLGGVVIMAIVSDILGLLNVSSYIQLIVTGLIVIGVVALNRRGRLSGRRDLLGVLPLFASLLLAGIVMFQLLGTP